VFCGAVTDNRGKGSDADDFCEADWMISVLVLNLTLVSPYSINNCDDEQSTSTYIGWHHPCADDIRYCCGSPSLLDATRSTALLATVVL
jgi:hypothetical protein